MSFKSLVNKLVKEGKSREAATKIAGKVANAKMKGAGSGPTAKQKARMKKGSPAKMEDKPKKSVTKSKKTYSLGKTTGEMVAKKKTVTKKDGSVKTIDKYKTKGGGKGKTKSKVVEKMESAAGGKTTIKSKTRNKRYSSKAIPKKRVTKIEGTTKYNVGPDKMTEFKTTSKTTKKSPTKMKKQGYNARLDDSLGAKHGKKKQSMKSRRDESEGMEKSMKRRKFSGNKSSAQGSPAKRFQAYDQMDTRNAAQTAGSPMGMYGKHSPANMSGQSYDAKEAYNKNLSASARLHYLENNRADAKAKKGGHSIHKHMGGRR